jgi:CDGSH-type Zn-finger protein
MNDPVIAQKSPCPVTVEAGKTYAWCSCGLSKNQPFCDGSHKGTGFAPTMYTAEKTGTVYFCGCKHSKTGATCDGSHKAL